MGVRHYMLQPFLDTQVSKLDNHFNKSFRLKSLFFIGIVRYLAGRFSETLQAKDVHGRTPLHYAAVIKDNGHFHNLLLHLGADPNIKDNVSKLLPFCIENII